MAATDLVGRCGLYCGACVIYRAYKDDGEYLKGRSERFKCPPEEVRCEGCQTLTPQCWGNECKIVKCLRDKGYQFCHQCAEYADKTCQKYNALAESYLEDGVDIRANLNCIQRGETQQWLRENEVKFRCPKCGKLLSVNTINTRCYHCNADLTIKH